MAFLSRSKETLHQLFKYGIVGLVSNLTGYVIFLAITYWGLEPKLAMTLLYMTGAGIGFLGNKKWAFKHQGAFLNTTVKYSIAHAVGYLMNFSLLWFFVDIHGYSHQWVQAGAIFLVAAYLFLAFRFFVFPEMDSCNGDAR